MFFKHRRSSMRFVTDVIIGTASLLALSFGALLIGGVVMEQQFTDEVPLSTVVRAILGSILVIAAAIGFRVVLKNPELK